MTAPRHRFSTEQSEWPLVSRHLEKFLERSSKDRSLHVIGEATEAGVDPACIGRIRPRSAPTAESGAVPITHAVLWQLLGKEFTVELRIPA